MLLSCRDPSWGRDSSRGEEVMVYVLLSGLVTVVVVMWPLVCWVMLIMFPLVSMILDNAAPVHGC